MKKISCIRLEANQKQISSCKETINEFEHSFDFLSNTLSLAGNTVRLKILYLLSQEKELCVCDLSDILEMNISAISQHLRKLKDRNIISPNRKAQTIYYALNPKFTNIFTPFFALIKGNKIMETV